MRGSKGRAVLATRGGPPACGAARPGPQAGRAVPDVPGGMRGRNRPVTAVAGHVITGRTAPALPPADAPGPGLAAPAGRGGRAARRVPGLRLQPAAVAGAAGRRPGHPDVGAAVPGGLPDRRLPWPGRHRRAGQRRPRPVTERRPGPLSHYRQAAAPRHRRRRGRPGRPAEGQPAVRAQGAGHAAARACRERRRGAAAAAVPVARRRGRGRQRAGRGLLAVRRPRAGRRASAGPARPGGPARRARPVRGLRRVPRVRARGRLPLRRRAARA